MRKMLAAGVAVLGLALMGCQPAEPSPTVGYTAAAVPSNPSCGIVVSIEGKVPKQYATSRVVLQRTVGGKWQDWKWVDDNDYPEVYHLLTDTPRGSEGAYSIDYKAPSSKATLHLRVRSNGGSVVSNGVYVTPKC